MNPLAAIAVIRELARVHGTRARVEHYLGHTDPWAIAWEEWLAASVIETIAEPRPLTPRPRKPRFSRVPSVSA